MDMQASFAAADRPIPGPPSVASTAMEHRWGHRMQCQARVRICASDGVGGKGRLRNVSMSGAYLETSIELPLYALVAVSANTQESHANIDELLAVVVREGPDGFGLEWCDTPETPVCRLLGCELRCAFSSEERAAHRSHEDTVARGG